MGVGRGAGRGQGGGVGGSIMLQNRKAGGVWGAAGLPRVRQGIPPHSYPHSGVYYIFIYFSTKG